LIPIRNCFALISNFVGESISNNRKEQGFLLVDIRISLVFLKPTYKVLSAESCSGGDTHSQLRQPIKNPSIKKPPVLLLLYTVVNKEVEQQFWGGEGWARCDIVTRETCQLRKSSCAAFCLGPLLQQGPCQTQLVS
jgi:hypothetical protein